MIFIRHAKKTLYFFVAGYFAFWASLYLKKWRPTVITVTGSTGKTTLLHLFQAQLGDLAIYSHKANSAFGIPFNILGLERKSFRIHEWFLFAFMAPFKAFRPIRKEKIYVAEADAERPGEGKFLSKLLNPDFVVWLSLDEAHATNYDSLISSNISGNERINELKKMMAREFGYFVESAKKLSVLNRDNEFINGESNRGSASLSWVSRQDLKSCEFDRDGTTFVAEDEVVHLPNLVPVDVGLSVLAVKKVIQHMELPFDFEFRKFFLPPGRSSVLEGKKKITIIDSTYNATMGGVKAMLDLFSKYPASGEKWLVLGDMVEQGKSESFEHAELAQLVISINPDRIILVGPRLKKYTYPDLLKFFGAERVISFMMPLEAHKYLEREIKGGETILFKGARFLESTVELLLENPADDAKLCRQESVWVERRNRWNKNNQ